MSPPNKCIFNFPNNKFGRKQFKAFEKYIKTRHVLDPSSLSLHFSANKNHIDMIKELRYFTKMFKEVRYLIHLPKSIGRFGNTLTDR